MIALKRILVATDFGEPADAALTYGQALARAFGATLHVLHVSQDMYMTWAGGQAMDGPLLADIQHEVDASAKKQLHDRLIDSDRSGPATTPALLTSNEPAWAIAKYAKDEHIDLIVMGTTGRKALAHFLMGSVAEKVVRAAPCPVLTVRHPEHDFVLPDTLVTTSQSSAPTR